MEQGATPFESLAEAYRGGPYAGFVQAERRAGSVPAPLLRFSQPAGAFPDPPTADYTLALNECGERAMRFDIGLGPRIVPFRRGDLVLKPPGVSTFFACDGPHTKSFISLPAPFVAGISREATGEEAPDFARLHEGAFRAPAVAALLELLWSEQAEDGALSRLFTDGAVLALVATLLRLGGRAPRRAEPAAGLAPARLARVRAFVEAHLPEPFGLSEMAASAGLSPFHFSRAFKAATGRTPRAFVLERRIERAKGLLAGTALPLADIAQGCGFADQAHFTRQFRRETGAAPGAWRRRRR